MITVTITVAAINCDNLYNQYIREKWSEKWQKSLYNSSCSNLLITSEI